MEPMPPGDGNRDRGPDEAERVGKGQKIATPECRTFDLLTKPADANGRGMLWENE